MANINAPRGFTPVKTLLGERGRVTRYWKDTTAGQIGIGDEVVRVVSSSDAEGGPEIVRATVGSYVTGIVVGIEPNRADLSKLYLAAGDSGYVYVCDDPDQVYSVQVSGAGTELAITDVGKHIDSITVASCNTSTGRSVSAINNNAKATDNTWILLGLDPTPGNEVGQYAKWLVKANLHTERNAGASLVKEI